MIDGPAQGDDEEDVVNFVSDSSTGRTKNVNLVIVATRE